MILTCDPSKITMTRAVIGQLSNLSLPPTANDAMTNDCLAPHDLIASPTAQGTNKLLWGDWSKREYGIILRTQDRYDNPVMMKQLTQFEDSSELDTPLLPASFLHASIRSPNSLFFKRKVVSAAVLVGSRFGNNHWSANKNRHHNDQGDLVSAPVCYPVDAGSNFRVNMLTQNGTDCHQDGPGDGICIGIKCLSTRANGCACNLAGRDVGSFLTKFLATRATSGNETKVKFLSPYSCWYDNTLEGMTEMISASNSIWMERKHWSALTDDRYRGWTECPVTANIRNEKMSDATLVTLPISRSHEHSLCNQQDYIQNDVHTMLMRMYELGYRNLPVVFLGQAKGMLNQTECNLMWDGTHCDDGYRKEIFAQSFHFSAGSCLAVPKGCKDVYFFPTCDISSDICRKVESTSPYHKIASIATSKVPPHSQEDQKVPQSNDLLMFPSFSMLAVINLVAMLVFYWLLERRKRGRRSI